MRSSKWFSVCAISLFASIAGNAMAAAAKGGVASFGSKAMAKKIGDQQLVVAKSGKHGKAAKAVPPKMFSFAEAASRDACAAKFDERKEGLGVMIKWVVDAQKRLNVKSCEMKEIKTKKNTGSEAPKKTEDAEEQPEEKAE
jgi:hypothetical protein